MPYAQAMGRLSVPSLERIGFPRPLVSDRIQTIQEKYSYYTKSASITLFLTLPFISSKDEAPKALRVAFWAGVKPFVPAIFMPSYSLAACSILMLLCRFLS